MNSRIPTGIAALTLLFGLSGPALATFHLYQVDQIYSNADGSVQFIDFFDQFFNEQDGQFSSQGKLTVEQGGTTHTFLFPNDLPSALTANTHFLVATAGYTLIPGTVAADFIVPNDFLFTGGGTIRYFSDFTGEVGDQLTYGALPTDGIHSITRNGTLRDNLAINFAGESGAVPGPVPEPANLLLMGVGLALVLARVQPKKRADRGH